MAMIETTEGKWDSLPVCVTINTRVAGMWCDPEQSGLMLNAKDGATDINGNPLKPWGHVPKKNDCTKIDRALKVGILIPCKPGGESKALQPAYFSGKIEELMAKPTRELIQLIASTRDKELLNQMFRFESNREQSKRRLLVINELKRRVKSREVMEVTMSPNIIKDSNGKLVKDVAKVN